MQKGDCPKKQSLSFLKPYDLLERFPEKPSLEADLTEEIAYTYQLLENIKDGVEKCENREIKEICVSFFAPYSF